MAAAALQSVLGDLSLNAKSISDSSMCKDDVKFPCCECVDRLAEGAYVDIDARDKKGKTPLQYAAFMGHEACAAKLIEAGCNVNQQSGTGATPLHFSAMCVVNSSSKLFELVVKNGGDPTLENSAGMTCLDCVKDPIRREKLASIIGTTHEYKGRKTKREKELNQETDSESEVEEEEPFEGYYQDFNPEEGDEDEEEDEEEDEDEWDEEDEEETIHQAYTHANRPREVTLNATAKSSPGPFHKEVDLWQP